MLSMPWIDGFAGIYPLRFILSLSCHSHTLFFFAAFCLTGSHPCDVANGKNETALPSLIDFDGELLHL
jgi:hypothetical protein